MKQKMLAATWLTLTLCACSCQSAFNFREPEAALPYSLVAAGQHASIDLHDFITALVDGRETVVGASVAERAELRDLYQSDRAPLWIDAAGRPTRNMRDALTVLRHAAEDGLDPGDYYKEPPLEEAASPRELARLDVALSAGMLRYLRDLHMGRVNPLTIGVRLNVPRDQHDFAAMLRAAIGDQRVANLAVDLRPPLVQYQRLRSMLPRYRSLAADPNVLGPRSIARAIHPGEAYRDADALQRLLIALGDLPPDAPAAREAGRYEGAIVEGVRRFQSRHGLESDGVVGKNTIAALSVPLAWRVRQIELALERLRWLPHLGDERLIALNIPMFRLWVWNAVPQNGLPLFAMDVIVGRAQRTQTPVFVEELREVIFRPYWNVPPSILRDELLPQIERDPEYLRRENMDIVLGEGDNARRVEPTRDALAGLKRGTLRVRQRPGPGNALGLIKFLFPNREDVYMHGTPAQGLFDRSRRDFSHGCVRVADPVALAEWVLQDRPEWTRDRILAATGGTQTLSVKLPRPIKVILFYATAAVMPEDGAIHFADDIYGSDVTLDRALARAHAAQ